MVAVIRRYHRWLMLFVGLQFVVWSLSGLYMVLIDIHSIHGEDLLSTQPPALSEALNNNPQALITIDINDVLVKYPDATKISLGWLVNNPVYRFQADGPVLLDASTGARIDNISKTLAAEIALSNLAEPRAIQKLELLTKNPPSEIGSRSLPLWRVDFEGLNSPTLYISYSSGEIVSVRQNTWRIFDLLWRLHIMDYYEGEDINNILLNVFSISGLLAALSGLFLLWFRLFRRSASESLL